MMKFHVPDNVSSYIKCSSQSNCKEKDCVAGFAAWYSCPVCAYRICTGCASVDIPDFASSQTGTVEDLLARQFRNFVPKVPVRVKPDVENALPGQVA